MTSEIAVRAEHLWCEYGSKFILRDVSFSVDRGEIAVIAGGNGVGKSTLLTTIAGAVSAARGTVSVFGYPRRSSVESERAARRMVVYLPDEAWLPRAMMVREYLGAAAALFEIPTAEAIDRIDALLDLFSLTEAESHSLRSLSTGQRKKVGLCSALLADRDLLLLDEPFSGGLDPAGIAALRRVFLSRRKERNQTIILTTPVAEIIAGLADRLLILRDGSLVHDLNQSALQSEMTNAASSVDALNALIFADADQRIQRYLDQTPSERVAKRGEEQR